MEMTTKRLILLAAFFITLFIWISPGIFADHENTGTLKGNFYTKYNDKDIMIDGLTVTLTSYDADNDKVRGQIATTKTNKDGNFVFEDVPVGLYIVGIDRNSGYFPNRDDASDFETYGGVFAFVRKNEETTFIMTDGTIYLKAWNIQVAKLAKDTSGYLPNAKLKITSSDASLQSTYGDWTYHEEDNSLRITTKDDSSSIYALPVGKYTLEEVEAPEGYAKAEPIPFEINEKYDLICDNVLKQTIMMYDEKN